MKKKRYLTLVFGLLCLAWTAVIFSFSLRNGETSSADSETALGLIKKVLQWFGIEAAPPELFVRKAAHFSEYFVLGGLAYATFFKRKFALLSGEGYAVVVALLDEFVCQSLSVGRGPSFLDVLLDGAGALCGVFAAFFILRKIFQKMLDKQGPAVL